MTELFINNRPTGYSVVFKEDKTIVYRSDGKAGLHQLELPQRYYNGFNGLFNLDFRRAFAAKLRSKGREAVEKAVAARGNDSLRHRYLNAAVRIYESLVEYFPNYPDRRAVEEYILHLKYDASRILERKERNAIQ